MNLFEYVAAFTNNLQGVSVANAIGVNPDIDTATVPECVVAQGGMYSFLSAASALEVVSDSANDTAAGTGARTVRLELLDANYVSAVVVVTLNGLAAVAVGGGPYLRVNDMRVASVGSGESNAGNITLRVSGGGSTLSYMLAGKGRAQQAVYTVPANRTAFAMHSKVGIIRAKQSVSAEIELQSRTGTGAWIVRNTVQASSDGNVSDISDPPLPPPFLQKTDIRYVVTNVSANDTAVHAVMQLLLVEADCKLPAHSLMRALRIA